MDYFNNEENVKEYIQMADGYNGEDLIRRLEKYLEPGSSVLELGMGPGKDLDILSEKYDVTGSDSSDVFLNMYKKKHPNAILLNLDAVSLQTERQFKCIYSNKVLHHLIREDLSKSLKRQLELLEDSGIALHTFWFGIGEELHNGLLFTYYTIEEIREVTAAEFKILELSLYKEMNEDDSIVLILKKL